MQVEKSCSFTGHRPEGLPWGTDKIGETYEKFYGEIRLEVYSAIKKGYTHFITGMARGIDLLAAEIVLDFKDDFKDLTLEAAVPYRNQATRWSEEEKKEYYDILEKVDKKTILSENYYRGCMMARNEYMVNHSSLLIAVYNGSSKGGTRATISYALKKKIDISVVNIEESDFYDYSSMLF